MLNLGFIVLKSSHTCSSQNLIWNMTVEKMNNIHSWHYNVIHELCNEIIKKYLRYHILTY